MKNLLTILSLSYLLLGCKPQEVLLIKENPPSVITKESSSITQYGAKLNGEVIDEGFTATIDRGFVFSDKNTNPSVSDSKAQSGYGKGVYSIELDKLLENTKYYYKAYATNTKGTSYGGVLNFATLVVILTPPKNNQDYKNIIGKPFKLGNLEIAQYDFPEFMDWYQATNSCLALGTQWRLPTLADYKVIVDNKDFFNNQINQKAYYWSSSEAANRTYAFVFLANTYLTAQKVSDRVLVRCLRSI